MKVWLFLTSLDEFNIGYFMSTHSINKFELTFRGNLRRFNFYTYSQLIKNHVNLGGFLKEIKGTAF